MCGIVWLAGWQHFVCVFFRVIPHGGDKNTWVLPEHYCKKDPCNSNTEMFFVQSWQPMSIPWSTSSQPDFVRALSVGEKTARDRQGKILYTEFLKSWSTLGEFLADSQRIQRMGSCRGLPCSCALATPKTQKQNPPNSPGIILWKFCLCVCFFMCFSLPIPRSGGIGPLSVTSPAFFCQRIPAFSWLKSAKSRPQSANSG